MNVILNRRHLIFIITLNLNKDEAFIGYDGCLFFYGYFFLWHWCEHCLLCIVEGTKELFNSVNFNDFLISLLLSQQLFPLFLQYNQDLVP